MVWSDYHGGRPHAGEYSQLALGAAVLAALLLLALGALRRRDGGAVAVNDDR